MRLSSSRSRIRSSTRCGAKTRLLPLSTTKLLLAAIAWDRGIAADSDSLIVLGFDSAGQRLARALRKELRTAGVLAATGRLGFPSCSGGRRLDCFMLSETEAG